MIVYDIIHRGCCSLYLSQCHICQAMLLFACRCGFSSSLFFSLLFSSVGVNVFRKACIALFYEHSIFLKLKARWGIYCHSRWSSLPLLHFLDAFLPFVLLLYRTMGSRCLFACLFVFHTMWTRFALLRFIGIFFSPPLFFFVYVTNLRVCVFARYNIRICIKRTAI